CARPSPAPQPAGNLLADRSVGADAGRPGAREGDVRAAGRGGSGDSPDAGRPRAPARGRRPRLDHRHRRHRLRDGMGRRRHDCLFAAQRRRRHGLVGAWPVSRAGAGNRAAARRGAGVQRRGAEGAHDADRSADRHHLCRLVRPAAGDGGGAGRLRRRRARRAVDAERAADPDRSRGGEHARGRTRHSHRVRDRRHEPADLRRGDGPAECRGRARRVLHAGADEEEPAGHSADGGGAARSPRCNRRYHLPRDDDDRAAPLRGRPRVPAARAGHRRDAAGRGALQGGAPRRPRGERGARVRGLFEAGRRAPPSGEGSAGDCRQGLPAMSRYFLTTAIDYVNSRPHLGTAYEKVCADVIARYKRLCGYDTRFLMGNDEHSQNVYKKAIELGLEPLAYCDRMEEEFKAAWRHLDVSFDDFIRTTEPRHKAGVTELAQRLWEAGDIYEGVYEGWYCASCEEFKQEKDLVDGNCPLHPTLKPEWIREKHFFFRLSKYQTPLLDHFAAHPSFLEPEMRRNEILRLVEGGLQDISVSRAGQSWGVPVPWDPSSVVYVWFDALINYASAVGLGQHADMMEKWWPADLHIVGKDITRFHAVFWPAMLMGAGLPLPRHVFGHGFMTIDGQRMSKTLGTII